MRITFASFITAVAACFFATNANAGYLCGEIDVNGYIEPQPGETYDCSGHSSELRNTYEEGLFSGACVTFSGFDNAYGPTATLLSCSIDTWACPYEEQLDETYGCQSCSNGCYAANTDTWHSSTECNVAPQGYYYDYDAMECYPCPGDGSTDEEGSSITDCYITYAEGTDESGTYIIDGDCYWAE